MSNVKRAKKAKSLAGERWKKIETPRPTLKMDYYVSNMGRLKSKSKADGTEHILTPTPDAKDYMKSSIKLEGGSYGLYVHMAVAQHWSKKPKKAGYNRYIHKDLNRLNNKASNIVWVTDEEWREYVKARAKKYGYVPHRKGGKPKLTKKEVIQIKKHLAAGRLAKSRIADKFGVSHTQVNRIEAGENWAHLEVEGFTPGKRDARKKSTDSGAPKKAPAKRGRKPAAKKAAAKTTTAKAPAKRGRKPAAKKAAAEPAAKAPAKRGRKPASKTTAAKAPAKRGRKPAAKKAAAEPAAKAPAKRGRKPAAKKTAAKSTTAKKTTAKKAAAKPAAKKAAAKAPAKRGRKPAAAKTAAKSTAKKTTTRKSTSRSKKK